MIDKRNFISKLFGWELQKSGIFFLGKEVSISVDTKIDPEDPDIEIFDEQIETINIIYSKWEELAIIIEQEILAYENISKIELLRVLDSPQIWLGLDYETNQPRKNNFWCFKLGVTVNEDFGWYVEFEGEIHQETGAGD